MMNDSQKQLVRDSWAKVVPIQETAAELFYSRLFDQHPEVRPYFKGDMKMQGEKLMKMLNTAVNGLDNLDKLVEPLQRLGARHVSYGVGNDDYAKVGECLLWTLQKGLGDAFTDDVKDAWTVTYTTVAEVMIDGAKAAPPPNTKQT